MSDVRVPKKDESQNDGNGVYLPVAPILNATQVALPLNFALPASAPVEPIPQLTGTSVNPPVPQTAPQALAPTVVSLPAEKVLPQPQTQPFSLPKATVVPAAPLPASTSGAVPAAVPQPAAAIVTAPAASTALPKQLVKEPARPAKATAPVLTTAAASDATAQPVASVPTITITSQQPPAPEPRDNSLPPLPAASTTPTPMVAAPEAPAAAPAPITAATLPQPPQIDKAPVGTISTGVPRARESAAPKDQRQEVSQPQTNWTPPAIRRLATPVPALPIAPGSPMTQEAQAAANSALDKLPPPAAGVPDPQQPQPQLETSPQAAAAPVPQPVPAELTFAVKVTPQETGDPTAAATGDVVKPQVTPSVAQIAPVKESRRAENDGPLPDGAPQNTTAHETPLPAAALPLVEKPAVEPPVSIPAARTEAPLHANSTEAAQMNTTPEAKPPQPVKQLSIQVGQGQQEKVELRVVERAGELQVSVRAANPDLAQGLRQGLSDLVGQLEQNGYHADAWRPGATAGMPPAAADKPQTQAGSQNNNPQSQSGWSQQDRQQGNHNPSHRPQWVEELETTSAGSGNRIAGETYGISR
jgi:hypothetical protein